MPELPSKYNCPNVHLLHLQGVVKEAVFRKFYSETVHSEAAARTFLRVRAVCAVPRMLLRSRCLPSSWQRGGSAPSRVWGLCCMLLGMANCCWHCCYGEAAAPRV